jgi:hypothetical protein
MAKTRKVDRLAVVLPDGTKADVEDALVKKYELKPERITPFSRVPTATVTRTIEQKSGPKEWTEEEDRYLLEHWETVAKPELARRLDVSAAALTKRHKALAAEQAKKKPKKPKPRAKKKSRSKKTK